MTYKTEALVLHTVRYGDSRLIIDMFTREAGRQSFIVSVSKTGRSAMRKPYFQPLTLLVIEGDSRPLQQLQKLRSAELLSPWQSLLTEPGKLAIALFVAEFLNYALRGEQKEEQLFDYVRASLEWLDGRADRYANFHLVFLMRLSRFLGFFPNLSPDAHHPTAQEPYFDLRAATFCATPPLHHDYLMPEEARRIRPLMRMDFATMHLFRLNRSERARMLEIIEHYYRLHLPSFPELRSLSVLHELYE